MVKRSCSDTKHSRMNSAICVDDLVSARQSLQPVPNSAADIEAWTRHRSTFDSGAVLTRRRFVQDEPVEAKLAGGLHELGEVDGLAYEAVRSEVVARHSVPFFAARRENDDRKPSGSSVRSQAVEHLQAVELRKLQIEENDFGNDRGVAPRMRPGREQIVERLFAIPNDHDPVQHVALLEREQREIDVVLIVLDEENGSASVHVVLPALGRWEGEV